MTELAAQLPARGRKYWQGRIDWWHRVFAADLERLSGEIQTTSIDLEGRDPADDASTSKAKQYLEHARFERDRGRVNIAWSSLKAARREMIDTMDVGSLRLKADEISREAMEKLSDSWRRGAIEDGLSVGAKLTAPKGSPDEPARSPIKVRDELRVNVKEACRLLDEYHDNVYTKIDVLRRHVMTAGIVLGIVLVLALLVAAAIPAGSAARALISDPATLFATMILGAIGAGLSGVIAPLSSDRRQRIPDARAQSYLVFVRPFVGAAAAIVVVAVLRAGIGGVTLSPAALPVAALAAGFSERLVGQSIAMASTALAK